MCVDGYASLGVRRRAIVYMRVCVCGCGVARAPGRGRESFEHLMLQGREVDWFGEEAG